MGLDQTVGVFYAQPPLCTVYCDMQVIYWTTRTHVVKSRIRAMLFPTHHCRASSAYICTMSVWPPHYLEIAYVLHTGQHQIHIFLINVPYLMSNACVELSEAAVLKILCFSASSSKTENTTTA